MRARGSAAVPGAGGRVGEVYSGVSANRLQGMERRDNVRAGRRGVRDASERSVPADGSDRGCRRSDKSGRRRERSVESAEGKERVRAVSDAAHRGGSHDGRPGQVPDESGGGARVRAARRALPRRKRRDQDKNGAVQVAPTDRKRTATKERRKRCRYRPRR